MPDTRTQQLPSSRRPVAWLIGCTLLLALSSCDDPEKEARLKWREEEVSAKEIDLVKREQHLAAERNNIEALKAQVAQRETQVEYLNTQLVAEIAKTKRINRELEIKQLRGPIPSIAAERAIVIDVETSDVLWEKNADKRGPVASTQKLLTALLVVENGDLDKEVTIELSDTQCAPVRIGLKTGEKYTRRHLLTALMVKSSNDIAQALARDCSGSVAAFVDQMNERVKKLGLQNSFFVNPHGLPSLPGEKEQYSTARDLSEIAKAVDGVADIRAMVSQKSFNFTKPDKKVTQLENTNRVLRTNAYCDGMKTGYTAAAGYCLVASGEKNGKRRIVIVLNDTSTSVWKDAEALLVWALKA